MVLYSAHRAGMPPIVGYQPVAGIVTSALVFMNTVLGALCQGRPSHTLVSDGTPGAVMTLLRKT